METPTYSAARKWGTVALACLAMLLLAIDLTVLHLAVPELSAGLQPSSTQLLWILDAYGFALAGLLITMGNLGDRIGRKRLLLLGSLTFGVASLITAYAPTPELLIAARALLGVAGATVMPSTLSIIRNVFTDARERSAAVGIWSAVGAAGFVVGPLLGGAMLGSFWWGSVFLLNLPVVALILLAGWFVLPESRNPRPGRLDPLSVVLSIGGVVGVIYAFKEAAHNGVWQAPVGVAAVVGVACLLWFVRRQARLADPLIDVRLFRHRAFSGTVAATVVAMFANLAMSLALYQYFQLVLGWSALQAGLAGLPSGVAVVIAGVSAGSLVNRLGRGVVVALGLAMAALGFGVYSTVTVDSAYLSILPAMLLFSFGIGMAFTVTTDTVLASVPRHRAGAASAISETATELGGAMGIAILGSVLAASYRSELALPAGVPDALISPIRESLGAALAVAAELPGPVGAAVADVARQAFVDGMQAMLLGCAVLIGALSVTVVFLLRGVPKVIPEVDDREPAAEHV